MAIKRRNTSKIEEEENDSPLRIPDEAQELEISSSDEEDELAIAERETEDAILDYADALRKNSKDTSNTDESSKDEDGSASESDADEDGPRDVEDDGSDSSEEERPQRNTVGEVPLRWYADEEHIGYDPKGTKLIKKERKDKLDQLLDKNDSALGWRTVYDAYNDEEVVLSKEEMKMIQNIRSGRFSHLDVNPFPDENDWFSRHQESMPLSAAPEPKRRFTPSKWEEKKIVKLVRAMRKGWLSTNAPPKKPELYLMWSEDGEATDKTVSGLTYLAAPKMKLPGHDESYNPPKEYLMSKEEENAAKLEAEENEDAPPFIPNAFDALRKVPAYDRYINERFERCLDLYLCPRSRVKRMDLSGTCRVYDIIILIFFFSVMACILTFSNALECRS
jgi:ribosome biogenesis protein ERB1